MLKITVNCILLRIIELVGKTGLPSHFVLGDPNRGAETRSTQPFGLFCYCRCALPSEPGVLRSKAKTPAIAGAVLILFRRPGRTILEPICCNSHYLNQQIGNTSQGLILQIQSQNHSVRRLLTGFIWAALRA